ncbi:MAG: MFS transporter [Pseudomonadota bacterium]
MAERIAAPTLDAPDWASIGAVTIGVGAFALAQGMTYPLISLTLASRDVSEAVIGANAAAFAVGLVVSTLAMPQLTRWFSAVQLILGGLFLSAAVLIGLWTVPVLAAWFVFRFVLGFAVNVIYVVGEAWVNAASPNRLRGRIIAGYIAAMSVGFIAGPLAVPLFGVENGFGFAACATILGFAAFAFGILSRRARIRPAPSPPGALLRFFVAAPALVLCILAVGFWDASALSVLPVYFLERGLDEARTAMTVSVFALGVMVSQPLLGLLLDRYEKSLVAMSCVVIAGATFAIMPFLDVQSFLFWAVLGVNGAAHFGLYTCCVAMLGDRFSGGTLVVGSAAFALAYAVGAVVGPPVSGWSMQINLDFPPWVLATMAPILVVGYLVLDRDLTRRERRREGEQ